MTKSSSAAGYTRHRRAFRHKSACVAKSTSSAFCSWWWLCYYLNEELNIDLLSRILFYGKIPNRKGSMFFLYLFVCFKHFSQKILIINSRHLFLVYRMFLTFKLHLMLTLMLTQVAFDVHFLRSFSFITSKISRKSSLQFFWGNVAIWANELTRSQLC